MACVTVAEGSSCFTSTISQPELVTSRFLTMMDDPGWARSSRAPSSLSFPSKKTSPSTTRALRLVISMLAPGLILSLMSDKEVPKEGRRTTIGLKSSLIPAYVPACPTSGILAPAICSILVLSAMASRSAVPALSGGRPFSDLAAASWMLFLTGEKQIHRSRVVKPTLDSVLSRRGKSCIMHSSLVGLLKACFDASAYLGFTNSFTRPPEEDRVE
mmetsp:Transcript_43042/g.136021  ORF Transcript_43042/g.136021 Transcript_43042/m.136021 type:complete len:215 (-) Transcript_43042:1314-1958(-)